MRLFLFEALNVSKGEFVFALDKEIFKIMKLELLRDFILALLCRAFRLFLGSTFKIVDNITIKDVLNELLRVSYLLSLGVNDRFVILDFVNQVIYDRFLPLTWELQIVIDNLVVLIKVTLAFVAELKRREQCFLALNLI